MKKWIYRIAQGMLLCCLAAALPAFAQDNRPRQNDHPEQRQAQRNERNAGHPQAQRPNQQLNRSTRPSPARPPQRPNTRRPSHSRPPRWGRPPSHRPTYRWRSNDRSRLHSYYMARLRAINRANRPVFRVGGYFPYAYIGYLSPLPPSLYGTLPPPPYGYQMGYYDGYVVVYDPATYFIASLIDLLQ